MGSGFLGSWSEKLWMSTWHVLLAVFSLVQSVFLWVDAAINEACACRGLQQRFESSRSGNRAHASHFVSCDGVPSGGWGNQSVCAFAKYKPSQILRMMDPMRILPCRNPNHAHSSEHHQASQSRITQVPVEVSSPGTRHLTAVAVECLGPPRKAFTERLRSGGGGGEGFFVSF